MKGNIYTSQRCPSCGGKMLHDERKHNCVCSKCNIGASGGYRVKFGRDISKRFNNYPEAAQFLSGLRFKTVEGSLDKRDYQKENPLGFTTQALKWLSIKEKQVCKSTYKNLYRYVQKAAEVFAQTNIKQISNGDVEDFIYADKTAKSEKTRHDLANVLRQFFKWVAAREEIRVPLVPQVSYELGWRKITDLDTQQAILDEVKRIAPAKVAFGIELLATYPKLRPADLRRIVEGDYRDGTIIIKNPTKRKNTFKVLQLLPEHSSLWERFQTEAPALPYVKFFRHGKTKGAAAGSAYGRDTFAAWWKKACANIGIKDLDLYGGTRHTTTTAIATMAGHENAKKASGHLTNKAFDRYCQAEDTTAFEMAKMIKGRSQVVDLKKKES